MYLHQSRSAFLDDPIGLVVYRTRHPNSFTRNKANLVNLGFNFDGSIFTATATCCMFFLMCFYLCSEKDTIDELNWIRLNCNFKFYFWKLEYHSRCVTRLLSIRGTKEPRNLGVVWGCVCVWGVGVILTALQRHWYKITVPVVQVGWATTNFNICKSIPKHWIIKCRDL